MEIYKDTALRLAPLTEKDVPSMVSDEGDRWLRDTGSEPVNMAELTRILVRSRSLVMDMGDTIESMDLNRWCARATAAPSPTRGSCWPKQRGLEEKW